jgi:hypothetical protein
MARWWLAIVLVACGGGPLDGSVHGQSIAIRDVVSASVVFVQGSGASNIPMGQVAMTTSDHACTDLTTYNVHANERLVSIWLRDFDGTVFAAPTAPATYTLSGFCYMGSCPPTAHDAQLIIYAYDAACGPSNLGAGGQSGTVELTSVVGGVFEGKLDVTLETGERVTGTFAPQACPQVLYALDEFDLVCR